VKRRLAALLQADVVGFSRLVNRDERNTHSRLNSLRRDFIDPMVCSHQGRIVKVMGDGFLCEFASVVDAAECALDWQSGIVEHEESESEADRFRFRIGIGLGDVIVDDEDVFGEGVNLAARLEAMAETGGILVTEDVYRQIDGKVNAQFSDLGPQTLKNIPNPVRVYTLHPPGTIPVAPTQPHPQALDKPSIAVMPFTNLSSSKDQDYFADGITEDIITALSRIRWFLVIARSTSFAYKETHSNARHVAAELGVRYILEGSVRRSGNRVRVTAELIDGSSGHQLWTRRYDRDLEDIFEVQDDITEMIVGAIEPELSRLERELAKSKRPDSLAAWDLYQRGMAHLYQLTAAELSEAQRLFEQALAIDPDLAPTHSGLAEAYYYEVVYGFAESKDVNEERALQAARRAVALDPDDPGARGTLGRVHYMRGEHEEAILELETALELNPSYALAHYGLGAALIFSGRAGEGLPHVETAIRLSPRDASMGSFLIRMAEATLLMDDPEQAVRWARKALQQPSFQWSRYAALLSALGALGRSEEAAEALHETRRQRPDFSIEFVRRNHLYTDNEYLSKYLQGLRDAGVPENAGS